MQRWSGKAIDAGSSLGPMTIFDFIVIFVLVVSVAISIWRGLAREVLSLLSWIGAFWLAQLFAGLTSSVLPNSLSNPGIRIAVAFIAVLMLSLLIFGITSAFIVHLVKVAGLTTTDRTLGAVFGVLRGALIVVILVLVAGMTSAPRHVYWKEALFRPPLVQVALWVKTCLPPELSRRINIE
jgi:membrane protein required for colicin V production